MGRRKSTKQNVAAKYKQKPQKLFFDKKQIHKMFSLREEGTTSYTYLQRTLQTTYNIVVTIDCVKRHNTFEKFAKWDEGEGIKKNTGKGRRSSITSDVSNVIESVIEDDSVKFKDIPDVDRKKTNEFITDRSILTHFKRSKNNPNGNFPHVILLETPLKKTDKHKPIN